MKLGKTYFSGSLTFDEGNNSIGPNTSNITGSFTGSLKGALTATGDIIPAVSGAFDLGSTAFPFKDLYITQNSLKFVDQSSGQEIGRISVNSNTGDIKLLNTKNLTEEEKATLTAESAGAEALSPVSASALWVSQSIFAGHQNTNIGHEVAPFHTLHTQFISGSSATLTGDLKVGGKVTAQEFHTEFVSASIIYQSGSTKFGDSSDDIHEFTGSISVSNGILGTLNTAAQTNITSLGTLSSLTVSGDLAVDTSTLKVDSTNNRVGIGTGTPDTKLEVSGDRNAIIRLTNTRTLESSGNTIGKIEFYGNDTSGPGAGVRSAIHATTVGAGNESILTFSTANASTNDIERMRITNTGLIGIGITSPSFAVDIVGSENSQLRLDSSDANDTTVIMDYNGGGASGRVRIRNANGDLAFNTSNSLERMRINSSGDIGIGTSTPTQNWTGGAKKIFQLKAGSGASAIITVGDNDGTNGNLQLVGSSNGDAGIYNFANGNMRFGTDSVERMRITSDGKVAIGTTVAHSLFHSPEFSQGSINQGFLKFISNRGGHTTSLVMAQITIPADQIYLFIKVAYVITRAPGSNLGNSLAGEFYCTVARNGTGSDVTITNDLGSRSWSAASTSAGGSVNIGSSTPNPRAERAGTEPNTDPQVVNITFGTRSNTGNYMYNTAAFEIIGTIKRDGISYTYY